MFGSVVFVIYFLWSNFVTSRESVSRYIEENMQLLLSLALDHWFAHTNITYTGREQLVADETLMAYRDRIRDELRLATYVYEKVPAPFESAFKFDDNGQATGLNSVPNLPEGARFATCAEVERHTERIEDMLTGWDAVMLKDAVKYGPRYGYKVDISPAPGSCCSQALIAVPKYPPADELDEMLKVQLIFDKFAEEHADKLTAKDYFQLLRKVKGSDADTSQWEQLCEYYNEAVNTNINPDVGISIQDLAKIYTLQSGELDRDYELLYPTLRPGEIEEMDIEELDRLSDESLEISASEQSDLDDTSDEDDEDMPNEADDEGEDQKAVANTEEDRIEYELKTKLNARKLQFIYNYVTQENRGQAIDELISSVPYLAAKTLETHLLLLSPVFGKEAPLGLTGPSSLRITRGSSALAAAAAPAATEEGDKAKKVISRQLRLA
ncbi:EF hand family protein, related [Eimeria brunetti]|uniref:EF hand family protein, related n=1 Tax=Eimeria brunetti TaxID=51314 RepID=U6L916_9EIME|nr:EF hand family protein, related [Eimeria brunetti]